MTTSLGAIGLALVCALISALATARFIESRGRSRLVLAQIDLLSFCANVGGVFSLVPEILQAFAPELVGGRTLVGSALSNLDYAAYVLVPVGVGMGLARRWFTVLNERAALAAPQPATF